MIGGIGLTLNSSPDGLLRRFLDLGEPGAVVVQATVSHKGLHKGLIFDGNW